MNLNACNGEEYDEKLFFFNVEVDFLDVRRTYVTISEINKLCKSFEALHIPFNPIPKFIPEMKQGSK